jgi:hypothetical protein
LRSSGQKWQVKPVQVVVFDDIRIDRSHFRDQLANQSGLTGIAVGPRLQDLRCPRRIPHGDHEDPIALGVQTCRLQIELHSVQVVDREAPEVSSPRRD